MYQEIFELHADLLKAMSHPRRLEVVNLLRDKGLNVGEMQSMLGLPQANLSQHLMVLREAGVLETEKKGKEVFYKLVSKNFVKASDLLREVLIERHKGDGLADELTMKMKDLVPVVTDPVCKMRVSPKTAARGYKHKGETYYFCAGGCYKEFKKNTKKYE
jgi:ArsR family transcriptional regulator, virulence genes transcriptional regulator